MLCKEGGAVDFFDSGATWRHRTTAVKMSGGLESKGGPIAATGIATIWEVSMTSGRSRRPANPDAKAGLAQVIGVGSACGMHISEKAAV